MTDDNVDIDLNQSRADIVQSRGNVSFLHHFQSSGNQDGPLLPQTGGNQLPPALPDDTLIQPIQKGIDGRAIGSTEAITSLHHH
jgi:hypothetical protein